VLAGAVLHHLRDEADWLETFLKIARLVKKGGWLFVSDLVAQHNAALTAYMWENYAAYLTELGGADYAQKVLAYVEKEDSPRSLNFQFNMLKRAGFSQVDLLHKNVCFAAFAACK